MSVVMLVILAALVGTTFLFLSTAQLPYLQVECQVVQQTLETGELKLSSTCTRTSSYLELGVSFPIYFVGVLTFLGWYFASAELFP